MSVQNYYEPIIIVDRIINNDAFGSNTQYIENKTINGAIGTLSRNEIKVAEAMGNDAKYIITIDKTDNLKFGTIIKRSNGQYLEVVSDSRDYVPPPISSFNWWQVYAKIFTMPK